MPDGFVASAESLHQSSVDVSTVRDHSAGHISALKGQLGQLQGAWKGAAATAFHQLFERFSGASDRLLNDLQTISESLDSSAKQYGHRDEETKSTFTSGAAAGGDYSF
jgi:WXG100 family type VII secretion target